MDNFVLSPFWSVIDVSRGWIFSTLVAILSTNMLIDKNESCIPCRGHILMCSIPLNSDDFPNDVLHRRDLFLITSFVVVSDQWSRNRRDEDTCLCYDRCERNLLQLRVCGVSGLRHWDVEGVSQVLHILIVSFGPVLLSPYSSLPRVECDSTSLQLSGVSWFSSGRQLFVTRIQTLQMPCSLVRLFLTPLQQSPPSISHN